MIPATLLPADGDFPFFMVKFALYRTGGAAVFGRSAWQRSALVFLATLRVLCG